MNKPIIEVKNLKIIRNGHVILQDVNFEIYPGEMIYIFGANGSGKSSLVKTILGLSQPDAGQILLAGVPASQKLVSQYFGYVPQYSLVERNFPISVEEMINLECADGSHCSTTPEGHLKVFDAEHLAKRKIKDLSGGEFQKVLIARALTNHPKILILDEPINNLDEKSQKNLLQFLYKLNKEQHITLIIISHDFNIIEHDDIESKILYLADNKVEVMTEHELLHTQHLDTQHLTH